MFWTAMASFVCLPVEAAEDIVFIGDGGENAKPFLSKPIPVKPGGCYRFTFAVRRDNDAFGRCVTSGFPGQNVDVTEVPVDWQNVSYALIGPDGVKELSAKFGIWRVNGSYRVRGDWKVEEVVPHFAMCDAGELGTGESVNGNVYTLLWDDNEEYWFVYKNDQQLYRYDAYDYDFAYNSFDVVDGHLVAGIRGAWSSPSYWIDGNKLTLDIDPYFNSVKLEAYAREGIDDLFVIYRVDDESIWYQFKGQSHHLPSAYIVSQAMIVDGDSYILALNRDLDQALLYMNGYKYTLNRPLRDGDEYQSWRGMMRRYGNDVYVLTNTWGKHSQIYKRNEPIDMSARIELRYVAGDDEHEKPLSDCGITDFIVLPPHYFL